jgi:methylmalonyl-CoA/ethylmalonyl-CoA epimerase|tara:strand:+ start:2284 stop:2688 length:405 start_codon:yes stop_codon:yes gene_type:complete
MIKKIEHVGIAVKDLEKSNKLFKKLLGQASYKTENVESENVATSFFKIGEQKIELLKSTSENSSVSRFLERRGEGMHHLALHVEDIPKEIQRLENEGFSFVSKTPVKGADNKMIVFLHPKTTNGVLIELCQEIK